MTTFLGRAAAASPLGACLVFADVNGDAAMTPHPSEPYAAGVSYGSRGAQGRVGVSEPNGAFTIRGQSSIVQAFPTFSLVLQPWVAVEMDDPTAWPSTSVAPVVKTYPVCKDGYTGLYQRLSLVSVPVSSGGVGGGVVTINPLSQLGYSWAQYAQQEGYCNTASCVSDRVALVMDFALSDLTVVELSGIPYIPEVVLDLASYDPYGVLSGAVHSGQAYDGMAVRVLLQTAKVSTLAVQLASLLFGARVRANPTTLPHLVEADGRSAYAALAQVLHGTPLSPDFNDDSVSGLLWDLVTIGFSKQGLGHSLWHTVNAAAVAAMKVCLDIFDDVRTDHPDWTDVPIVYTDASDVTLDHRYALSNVVDAISATSHVCGGDVADEMEALAKKQTTSQSFAAATSPTQLAQLVASSAAGSSILRFRDACSASLSACSQHVADCCGSGTVACTPVNPFDPGSSSWCNTVG